MSLAGVPTAISGSDSTDTYLRADGVPNVLAVRLGPRKPLLTLVPRRRDLSERVAVFDGSGVRGALGNLRDYAERLTGHRNDRGKNGATQSPGGRINADGPLIGRR